MGCQLVLLEHTAHLRPLWMRVENTRLNPAQFGAQGCQENKHLISHSIIGRTVIHKRVLVVDDHVPLLMSGATPTLIPRKPLYPRILPHPPVPHAIPMPLPRRRCYRTLNTFRDIFSEMDDLSDEENELDDEVSTRPIQFWSFLRNFLVDTKRH
jgi:hypothetical protein